MYRPKPRRRVVVVGLAGWRTLRGAYGFTLLGRSAFFCDICGIDQVLWRMPTGKAYCTECLRHRMEEVEYVKGGRMVGL